MKYPLRVRWARYRADLARRILDRILRDRKALWLVRVGTRRPQMEGKIICVRVEHDFHGHPERLTFSWQPFGMSLYDIRTVNAKALHYDRNLKKWVFYDC